MNINKIVSFVTVIILIILVIIPTVYKVTKNHDEALYKVVNKKVIEAAITCKNTDVCKQEKITLKELYENNYLEKVSDPKTKEIYKDSSYVIYKDGKYQFIIED